MSDLAAFIVRRRVGRVAGLAAVLLGSTLYRSDQHRQVLGMYSPVFAAWLVLIVLLLVGAVLQSVVAPRRADSDASLAYLVEGAWVCSGAAYLVSALNDPRYAARAFELNFFGSPFISSALLEYAALCCLVELGLRLAIRWARGRGQKAILLLGALCVLTLVGEGVARAAAFIGAQTHGIPSYSGDVFRRRYVRLNKDGFRDTEHALAPPPDTRRLLLVGDSYAFGAGVRQPADRFSEQLQAALTRMSGQSWEVINNSFGDWNTLDELVALRQGLAYDPEVVVLLYVFNDADYLAGGAPGAPADSGVHAVTQRSPIFGQPHSLLGRLEPARVLYLNSFLFQELYARWRLVRYRFARPSAAGADVYRTPSLLQRHIADLEQFVRIADSAGAIVVILPIDPGAATEASLRDRYQTFMDAAVRAGLPVWSMMDVYQGHQRSEIVVNSLDGHLNAFGYHLAVEAVAPKLLATMEKRPPRN